MITGDHPANVAGFRVGARPAPKPTESRKA